MHDPANWVVLILVGGVLSFFAYVIVKSHQQQKSDNDGQQDTGKDKEKT